MGKAKQKVFILGYFGFETNQIDGQTLRTRNVYQLLKEKKTNAELKIYDTEKFQKSRFSLFRLIWLLIWCDYLIYLPGLNNLLKIYPLIKVIRKFSNFKIIHIAIGGWLYEFIKEHPSYIQDFQTFEKILVQTKGVGNRIKESTSLVNIEYFPNFRIHNFKLEKKAMNTEVLKLVFMARISKSKGLEVIFRFAEELKRDENKKISIHFYGPMDEDSKLYFYNEKEKYDFVKYYGAVEPLEVYEKLSDYDVLLLPTHYDGEGFPGSILDAYISGIPVIVSNWKDLPEFVDQGDTGFVYDLEKEDDFRNYIYKLEKDRVLLDRMKRQVIVKSAEFSSDVAWLTLKDLFESKNI